MGGASSLEEPREVRFAVLGDTQFANPDVFERLTHEIELMEPAFAIQVGDLINGYTYDEDKLRAEWKRFRAQIAPLSAPFYPVPGNHDVVTPEAEKVYVEEWGKEKLYYSFDVGPVHCVVLNSWYGEEDDRIADWQRDWLTNGLADFAARNGGRGSAALAKKSVFVFLHSPLWRYKEDTEGRQDWNAVHAILQQYPVRMVVAGHTHEYVWEERDGIQYVVINSSGGPDTVERAGNFHVWLHVTADADGEVRTAVVKPGSILPLDTVNSAERASVSRYLLRGGSLRVSDWTEGKPLDATVTVPLKNEFDEPRTFHLEWRTPRGAELAIVPRETWVDLGPGETKDTDFRISSDAAPSPTDRLPFLEVESETMLRTGVVSRSEEARYREALSAAKENPEVYGTRIALDAPVTFTARYRLYVPPEARASHRQGEIRIDGVFDEAAWKAAPVVEEFTTPGGDAPEMKTTVRFLYDGDGLYVAAWMEEPDPDGLVAKASGDIPLTWNDDDLELFFDTEQSQRDYTRLFQNAAGTRFNSLPRHIENKYFESEYESAIHVGENYWALEMHIPWKEMSAEGAARSGDRWGINVGRHRPRSAEPTQQWAGPLYQPSMYGVLVFE